MNEAQNVEQGTQNGDVNPKVADSLTTNNTNLHECPPWIGSQRFGTP